MKTNLTKMKSIGLWAIAIFSFCVFIYCFLAALTSTHSISKAVIFTSDSLHDLILLKAHALSLHFNGWNYGERVDLFPCYFLLNLVYCFTHNVSHIVVLYIILYFVIIYLTWFFLMNSFSSGEEQKFVEKFSTFNLIFSFFMVGVLYDSVVFFQFFRPVMHIGEVINIAILQLLLMWAIKNDAKPWSFLLLFVGMVNALVSNPLITVIYVVPLALAMLFAYIVKLFPRRLCVNIFCLIVVSYLCAFLLNWLLAYGVCYQIFPLQWPVIFTTFKAYFSVASVIWWFRSWVAFSFFLVYAFCYLIILFYVIKTVKKSFYEQSEICSKLFLLWSIIVLISPFAVMGVLILVTIISGSTCIRYHIANIVMIPLTAGWAVYKIFPERKRGILSAVIFLLLSVLLLLGINIVRTKRDLFFIERFHDVYNYTPDFIGCLDSLKMKYNLQYGLAEYWRVNLINEYSATGLQARLLYDSMGKLYYFSNNVGDYLRTPYLDSDGVPIAPVYNYVYTAGLNPSQLEETFGKPNKIEYCGDDAVFIYLTEKSQKKITQMVLKKASVIMLRNFSTYRIYEPHQLIVY